MARKKIQSETTGKGRMNLQAKAKKTTTAKKKPGPKPKTKTKQITGYNLLKRDENALVKAYAKIETEFEKFAECLNDLCYENGDKKKSAVKTNQAALAFGKETVAFKKVLAKAKSSLKPIYS
jgi:ribulose 1,5-bisphosphate carboxylase large subunit-like protein